MHWLQKNIADKVQIVGFLNKLVHGSLCCWYLNLLLFSIRISSDFEILRISEGKFLNQTQQITTQKMPIVPLTKKVARHPNAAAIGITIRGASAAPVVEPRVKTEVLLAISFAGNQREMTAEQVG